MWMEILIAVAISLAIGASQIRKHWLRAALVRRLATLDDRELRALIEGDDASVIVAAVSELHRRGDDIKFALPVVINLALSKDLLERMLGKGLLDKAYPTIAENVRVLSGHPRKYSEEARAYLRTLADGESYNR